jgi:hypothetical protein
MDELLNLHPQGVIKLDMVDSPRAAKIFIENLKLSEALGLDKTLRNCIEAVIDHLKAKFLKFEKIINSNKIFERDTGAIVMLHRKKIIFYFTASENNFSPQKKKFCHKKHFSAV